MEFQDKQNIKSRFTMVGQTEGKGMLEEVSDLLHDGEEARTTLEALMEHIPAGVIIADVPDGHIRLASRYCIELTGKSREELENIPAEAHSERWGVFKPDGATPRHHELPLWRAIHNGESCVDEEWLVQRADGSLIPILVNAGPVLDIKGGVTGGVVVFRDISQIKESHAQVVKLAAELEQRVAERTSQLEAANRELEAFSYSVSHDLRAPLRSFLANCSILLQEGGESIGAEEAERLHRMKSSAEQMRELIEDLLMLSRFSRSELIRHEVDLSKLFSEALRPPNSEAEVYVEPNLLVQADPRLIKVAVQNLSENALKFSSKNPRPHVWVEREKTAVGEAIVVRDNGVGFDQRLSEQIFQPFKRLWTEEEFHGSGVGLAIVERVIRRHGGRIWAVGTPGHGAAFYFTLP